MMDVKKPNKQTRHACVEVESWKKKKHVEVCAMLDVGREK